jgi:hypothetical protein
MTKTEKQALVSAYKTATQSFLDLIKDLSAAQLDFRPQPDFWTIREQAAHVMDAEVFGFTRYRKAIAQPGSVIEAFDQDALQAKLDYPRMDIAKASQIIGILNELISVHLSTITDLDWTAFKVNHSERGLQNLEQLIDKRISHTNEHIGYIRRNLLLFAGKNRK